MGPVRGVVGARVRRKIRRLGFDLVRYPVTGSLWEALDAVFRRSHVACVLDVGAHTGEYATFLRSHGYEGEIVSFEPVPASAAVAAARAASDASWHVHEFALGATTEIRAMAVANHSNFSSFLPASAAGRERFGAKIASSETIDVQIRRLDEVFGQLIGDMPAGAAFLKCDTQGFDLEVVTGAGEVIPRLAGIQLELDLEPLYQGAATLDHGIAKLRECGFAFAGLWPVVRTPAGALLQVEAVFVHERVQSPLR